MFVQYSIFNVQRSIMVYPLQTILITDRVRYKNNKVADGGGRLNLALLLEYNKIQISYSESIKQQDRIEFSSSSYHSRPEEWWGISPFASRLGRDESREPIFMDALEGGEYSADSLRLEVEYGEGGKRSEGEFSCTVSRGRCGERDERWRLRRCSVSCVIDKSRKGGRCGWEFNGELLYETTRCRWLAWQDDCRSQRGGDCVKDGVG